MGSPMMPPPATGTPSPAGLDSAVSQALKLTGAPAIGTAEPPYLDDKRLTQIGNQTKTECLDGRWIFERSWWRNIMYVLGRQWIYYDRRRGQWVDKRMAKWVPRPVTNLCSSSVESIQSLFASITLQGSARPVGAGSANIAAAEIADAISPLVHEEHGMDEAILRQDWWLIVTGNAFLHPMWDKTAVEGGILLPWERCVACGEVSPPREISATGNLCPKCKQGRFIQAADAGGQIIGEQLNVGKGRTEALSPFEIAIPSIYDNHDDSHVTLRLRFRPKTYYEDHLPHLVSKITWQKSPTERSLQVMRALATQGDASSLPTTTGFSSGAELAQEGISEYEIWRKPNKEFPEGLFFRMVEGGLIVRSESGDTGDDPGPIPTRTRSGQIMIPFIHVGYTPVEGRLWARSPLDLGIQKQDQLNQLDSLSQMIVQRMANPVWLKPRGAEIRSFTGEPGLVVEYNPLSAGNAKPERIGGENVPQSIFAIRQQYISDFEQLVGTYDVIKGTKPSGVEAFSALQLLVERSQSRFTTVFNARGQAYRKWLTMAIELERTYGPEERVQSIVRPNRSWTFKHFQNAKLNGAIDIVVEDGSQAPKTSLGKRASIEQARQLGLLNAQDPEQQYAILKEFGLADLMPSLDFHLKAALNEQDAFEQWGASLTPEAMMAAQTALMQFQMQQQAYQQQAAQTQSLAAFGVPTEMPPPPVAPVLSPLSQKLYHKASVHWNEHIKWANTDAARELFSTKPVTEQVFLMHLQETQSAMMAEAMMAAGPPQQGPPQRGGPMERSNSESGNPADVPHGQGEGAQNQGPQ
jgi:hypothetical protein